MVKNMFVLTLIAGLSACSATENPAPTPSAEEQVAGIAKMCSENAEAMQKRQQEKSLYARLGERAGIEAFATNLYASHQANTNIGHFFKEVPAEPFIANVTDFVVVNSGGGGEYTQRDMTTVHKDLGISHADFLQAGGDVQATLTKLGHGENEIQEVVCFLVSLLPTVVTK